MSRGRVALVLGVVFLGLGVVTSVAPGLVPVSLDRILLGVLGVLALVQAIRVIQDRRHSALDEATTPDPERPATTPSPGDELVTVLAQFLGEKRLYYHRRRLRDGLQAVAVAVLTRYEGRSDTEARELLEAGTWTENVAAASFLGGEEAPTLSLRARFRDAVHRESSLTRQVGHTVDAIAATAGLTDRSTGDAAGSGWQNSIRAGAGDGGPASDRRSGGDGGSGGDDGPRRRVTAGQDHAVVEGESDVVTRELHPTGHWRGIGVVALVGIGAGLLADRPGVVLAGIVGIGFAAYARSAAFPPGNVSVSRTLAEMRPAPGDEVAVTLTVTNESERALPDLRIVDGVPAALAVTDGSPRLGTALRPGESATVEYAITARRGVHSFEPTVVVARDLAAAREQEVHLLQATALTCIPRLRAATAPVPLREQTTQYVGAVETATGGEGREFYGTREYRPGDELNRLDWNRRARTGEFTTVEYRQERATRVVVLVDARVDAYVSPTHEPPHAVDRAVDAASRLFAALTESGNRVGIAAVGSDSCWLAPDVGRDHATEARELLATHPALAPIPGEANPRLVRWRTRFRKRLSPGTQILFLTPLCDSYGLELARRFEAAGYPVTVVSPDPTADRTAGHRLAGVVRTLRVTDLRRAGVSVVDWPWDDTVDEAMARYTERWSR